MSSQQQEQQNINNSNNNNLILSTNNQQTNKNQNTTTEQPPSQNSNLNKSHQFPTKDIRLNKLNMNSSLNIPSANTATNISLNDQNLHPKKEQSDYFDNEVSYQDEEEGEQIFKEYTMINDRRNKAIDDFKNINERIKINNIKIEELKKKLIDLKEEKKQKQNEIFNLLSNKESLEEIYKNQIYSLNSNHSGNLNNNFNDNTLANDINNLINISIKNDINDNSMINLNSNHNITILDNEILNADEDNFKIALKELKESDQKKYIEQVINMFEDIFKKKDEKLNSLIANIINNSYELFVNNISNENDIENNNNDLVVTNFFGKVSLFISNHSLGKYSESKINLFLRYLLKINYLNVKLSQYIKFVNKKYKEKKKELNDMINFLEKKNINLNDKTSRLETNIQEYDDRLEFFGKNDVFEIEQKSENSDEGLYDGEKEEKKMQKRKVLKNRNKNINNNKNGENEEQLSHDVVIEYEDGIDQNVEINYEEDDLAKEDDYEKENEMINQGLNPYKNDNSQLNNKKNSVIVKQNIKKNNKQIIVKDNDESDKCLNEFLNKSKNDKKNKRIDNLDYLIIDDDKNFLDINNDNILEGKKDNGNKRKRSNYINNKNNKNGDEFQLAKKVNYNNVKSSNMENNVISDNRIFPTPHIKTKTENLDLENELTAKEIEHYHRVQRIMNSGPKVNNIFGVNNYNPENSMYSINKNNNSIFSPQKNVSNISNSSNKIDKTIRIGRRQNHNFISIINMTKTVPVKKKNGKDKTKNKEKNKKKESEDNNDGVIQIINLEENFLNEIKDEDKNENENKTGNESTSNQTNNNSKSNKNNSNSKENIENDDNSKPVSIKVNENKNNSNKNEVQGYYLNIINSKEPNQEKEKNNSNININENNTEKEITDNKTMKITKSRELNINDIKNTKIDITKNKLISKTHIPQKGRKVNTKLIYLKNQENKEESPLNNSLTKNKTNKSFNNSFNQKISSHNSLSVNPKGSNSYINLSGLSKKSLFFSENIQNNKQSNNTNSAIINNSYNNSNISPIIAKSRKITNIPTSKNQNYNGDKNEGNFKKEKKLENSNVNNRNK